MSAGHILTREECAGFSDVLQQVIDGQSCDGWRELLQRLADDMQQGATDGPRDAQTVAAYLAYLDRRMAVTKDPREHETCKRLAGNVMKLAAW